MKKIGITFCLTLGLFLTALFLKPQPSLALECDPRQYNFNDRLEIMNKIHETCTDAATCETACLNLGGCPQGWNGRQMVCWPKGATTEDPSCTFPLAWNRTKGQCCAPYDDRQCDPAEPKCLSPLYNEYDKVKKACINPTGANSEWELETTCTDGTEGVQSAIGCIPTGELDQTVSFVLKFALGAAGGVMVLMIIVTGYGLMTSQGNPEKLAAAKENVVSIITGLILIVFSLVLLQTIGAGILGLPTF